MSRSGFPTLKPTFFPTSPTRCPSIFPSYQPATSSIDCWNGNTLCTSTAKNLTIMGMIYTLILSLILLVLLIILFEYSRHYKQIFMKRYQKRFINIGRVPSQPLDHYFGWLTAIWNVSESEVLHMVGLDAYMCLRYHVICLKLGVFVTIAGLVVLLPIYSTVPNSLSQWDKYTILNVAGGETKYKNRFWVASLFAYLFAAYFCQLFYKEYDRFSTLRLSYLAKSDEVRDTDETEDPDVMPQKDYSIMLEYIPAHLRSEEKLYEYFDELFPGEVFTVEVALDLRDLEKLVENRLKIRNNLECAIAYYIATSLRQRTRDSESHDLLLLDMDKESDIYKHKQSHRSLLFEKQMSAYVQELETTGTTAEAFNDSTIQKLIKSIRRQFSYGVKVLHDELHGRDLVDAIDYYIATLQELNSKTTDLQEKLLSVSKRADVETEKKIKMKHDTRAALVLSMLGNNMKNDSKSSTTLGSFLDVFNLNESESKDDLTSITDGKSKRYNINTNNTNTNFNSTSSSNSNSFRTSKNVAIVTRIEDKAMNGQNNTTATTAAAAAAALSNDNVDDNNNNNESDINTSRQSLINSNVSDHDHMPHSSPAITTTTTTTTTEKEVEISSSSSSSSKNISSNSNNNNNNRSLMMKNADFLKKSRLRKEAVEQVKITGTGALRGIVELERSLEMVLLGAYYKYSSTAFVTFKNRIAELTAHSMTLDHDRMEIHHAPSTNEIIWNNLAIPKSQINYRNFVTNILLVIGSIFWSSLVTALNDVATTLNLPKDQESFFSVIILLGLLLVLPFIFDAIARYYEGMKLESEIQDSIMSRYFYYQLVNIYVTVCLTDVPIHGLFLQFLKTPQLFFTLMGQTVPAVSLYFCSLVIVKICVAVPLEMCRPFPLATVLLMSTCMDKRKYTRRGLRTGAFYSWPMLYGWIYPQLVIVQMIMIVYAPIAPLLMPFCLIFFAFCYQMYKYQLLYVYVNTSQSGGYMWYAVFNRSLLGLVFGVIVLLSFLALDVHKNEAAGPFIFLFPLPFALAYFWHHCDIIFKKKMDLSFRLAKQRDFRNNLKKEIKQKIPLDSFKQHFYRQPALTEPFQYPEEYRKMEYDEEYSSSSSSASAVGAEEVMNPMMQNNNEKTENENNFEIKKSQQTLLEEQKERQFKLRMKARSIDVYRVEDEIEDSYETLERYFNDFVLRLQSSNIDIERQRSVRKSSVFYQHAILNQNELNDADGSSEEV